MILPDAADRSIVVFKVWPSLDYRRRLLAAFVLIVAGLAVQFATSSFFLGAPLVVLGNLLLLVSGYDNRVEFGKYDPGAEWARVDAGRLDDLKKMDREIRRWDLSALDVTNVLGLALFIVATAGLVILAILLPPFWRILVLDAALLLLPHWLTGTRSVLRTPKLLLKVELLQRLFGQMAEELGRHKLTLLMLLQGEETQVPSDVKFRVEPAEKPEGFLGMYGQTVLNEVQGRSYPYFYIVLVGRKGFGIEKAYRDYHPPGGVTKEFKPQGEVEVLVVRQTTTKKSGYHTKPVTVELLLHEGLKLMERATGPS